MNANEIIEEENRRARHLSDSIDESMLGDSPVKLLTAAAVCSVSLAQALMRMRDVFRDVLGHMKKSGRDDVWLERRMDSLDAAIDKLDIENLLQTLESCCHDKPAVARDVFDAILEPLISKGAVTKPFEEPETSIFRLAGFDKGS